MSFLYVVPNPFTALDKEGNPCGFCYADPATSRPFQVIGGTLTRTVLAQDGGDFDRRADTRGARVYAKPLLDLRAVRVTNSKYHQERVVCGDLIAVDLATALACNIQKKDFKSPGDILAGFLAQRVEEWKVANDGAEPPCAGLTFACEGEGEALVVKTLPKSTKASSPPKEGKSASDKKASSPDA